MKFGTAGTNIAVSAPGCLPANGLASVTAQPTSKLGHVHAPQERQEDRHGAAPRIVRFALVALLIVGSCGGGSPDAGTASSTTSSAQTQQVAREPGNPTQATLYWDPVTKPPVDGYRIHYGTQSGVYSTQIYAGNVTSWTVQNLAPATYYFAVTAVKAGYESAYSNEVSTTIKGGDGG